MNILIKINSVGDFVFPSSKYCVVFNKKKNVQVFYEGHSVNNIGHLDAIEGLSTTTTPDGLTVQETDAVVCCVSTSNDGQMVASATECKRPNIHIWDANTCVTLCVLQVSAIFSLFHRCAVLLYL
jgi:WD40 repeat protein